MSALPADPDDVMERLARQHEEDLRNGVNALTSTDDVYEKERIIKTMLKQIQKMRIAKFEAERGARLGVLPH